MGTDVMELEDQLAVMDSTDLTDSMDSTGSTESQELMDVMELEDQPESQDSTDVTDVLAVTSADVPDTITKLMTNLTILVPILYSRDATNQNNSVLHLHRYPDPWTIDLLLRNSLT